MKTCGKCGQEFEDGYDEYNLMQDLGEALPGMPGEPVGDDLCPKCREKLGMSKVLFWFDS